MIDMIMIKNNLRNTLAKSLLRDIYHYVKDYFAYMTAKRHIHWKRLSNIGADDFAQVTYADLEAILRVKGRETYEALFEKSIQNNLEILRHKKIKVVFLLYDASMWIGDNLYRLLEKDDRFDVEVVFSPRQNQKVTPLGLKNDAQGVEMLRKNHLYVEEDREEDRHSEIDADILIWCDPYPRVRTRKFHIENIPLTKLMVIIPYCFTREDSEEALKRKFNNLMYHFAWIVFADTKYLQEVLEKYSDAGNRRVDYSGYPKMDAMYSSEHPAFIWKLCSKNAKKIIWSPHWSIHQIPRVSTFLLNYKFFYEYAKANPETTSWVVKPHPNLLFSAVCEGGFSSHEEAKAYFDAWNQLPNAQVVLGGNYSDLFKTSDAMINDSGSFMTEYQYVHKPMLHLERKEPNDFGYRIKEILYRARGDDYKGIEAFINDVVIGGKDVMKEKREAFFEKELDYQKVNGCLASVYIYRKLVQAIWEGKK